MFYCNFITWYFAEGEDDSRFDDLMPYWKAFGEWFCDEKNHEKNQRAYRRFKDYLSA